MARNLTSLLLSFWLLLTPLLGGVSKQVQDRYKQQYENKALFLKIPVRGDRQIIHVGRGSISVDRQSEIEPVKFKVTDQVRVISVSFGGDEIKFKISSIDLSKQGEIVFKFPASLQDDFPEAADFDAALDKTFTWGLTYKEIDRAKEAFLQNQFERFLSEAAGISNSSRDFVIQAIAEKYPPYVSARQDVQNLTDRNRELSAQINNLTARSQRLESELHQVRAENDQLKRLVETLRLELNLPYGSPADLTREVRSIKQQIANLQRSLNLSAESAKDLTRQIDEMSRAFKQLQRDKAQLDSEFKLLRSNYEKARSDIEALTRENTSLKTQNEKLNRDLQVLTQKEGSLAKKYMDLQAEKDHIEEVLAALRSIKVEPVSEAVIEGYRTSVFKVKLREAPIGLIEIVAPVELKPGQSKRLELRYSAESIDYVKLNDAERKVLNSLGEKFKVRTLLADVPDGVEVKPLGQLKEISEIAERSSYVWQWELINRSHPNPQLTLQTSLLSLRNDEVPLLLEKISIFAPDLVAKAKEYLQPIPIALGAICGFILFGIVGAFRRSRNGKTSRSVARPDYVADKKL